MKRRLKQTKLAKRARECKKKYRDNNRAKVRASSAQSYRKCNARYKNRLKRILNKRRAVDYFGGVCFDCTQKYDIVCFDFHHVKGEKDTKVSAMMNGNWDRILKEIRKCILLCANCHRLRHKYKDESEDTKL